MDQSIDSSESNFNDKIKYLFEKEFEYFKMTIKKINNDIIVIIGKIDEYSVFALFPNADIIIHDNTIYIYNICNHYTINDSRIIFENIMVIHINIKEYKKMQYDDHCQNRLNIDNESYNLFVLIYDNFRHLPIRKMSSHVIINNEIEFSLYKTTYIKIKDELYIGIDSFRLSYPEYFITHKLAIHNE